MKYIVTGGAGFIGSHIAKRLVKEGKEVVIIDDLSSGSMDNIAGFKEKVKFIKGSITDPKLLNKTIGRGDIIFHQAAIASVIASVEHPEKTHEVNITGTLNILNTAKKNKAKRVVFASSSAVYGDSKESPKKESMQPQPLSPYALSKLTSEQYLQLFYGLYGLETVSLRYFNVFGPRQDPYSEYSAVIPKFLSLMAKDKQPTIYGDGKQTRDFIYIGDVVEANMIAATSESAVGGVFNIACGKDMNLLQLVKEINTTLNTDIKVSFAPARQGDIKESVADISRAKKILGFTPTTTFKHGLQELKKSFEK